MGLEISSDRIVLDGVVKSVTKSLIPQVYLVSVEGSDVRATFDVHKSLLLRELNVNSKVRITLSKSKPEYRSGVDLVMRGYIMSKKTSEGQAIKLLVSLWGYLLILESPNAELSRVFNYMDEVYFKLEIP